MTPKGKGSENLDPTKRNQVGRTEPGKAPSLSQIANTLSNNPAYSQVTTKPGVVVAKFQSQGEPRTLLVGNFNDVGKLYPDLTYQAGEYLPTKSVLYKNKTPEQVRTRLQAADKTSLVVNSYGRLIGMATLTSQAAFFGEPVRLANGQVEVRNLRNEPVLFLAQVAGETGGGKQAVQPLLEIAKDANTTVVATTFPTNFQQTKSGRAGLYGSGPGGLNPDFAALWTKNPRARTAPDRFGPDQPIKSVDGKSIFEGLPSEPKDQASLRMADRIFWHS